MNIRKSLVTMIDNSLAKGVTKSAKDWGREFDQLPWPTVWDIIMEIFENTGIYITVYQLTIQASMIICIQCNEIHYLIEGNFFLSFKGGWLFKAQSRYEFQFKKM